MSDNFLKNEIKDLEAEKSRLIDRIKELEVEHDKLLFLAHGPKCYQCWYNRINTPADCLGTFPKHKNQFFEEPIYNFCNECADRREIENRELIDRQKWLKAYHKRKGG